MARKKLREIDPKERQRIANEGLEKWFKNPTPIPITKVIFACVIGFVILTIILWEFLYIDLVISLLISVVVIAIALPILKMQLAKDDKNLPLRVDENLKKLAVRYDSIEKSLKEIEKEIANGNVYLTDNLDIITDNWFVITNGYIIKHEDIVAIWGTQQLGTQLLLMDGEVIKTTFGTDTWGETFNLILSANPYLLDGEDAVATPDGKDVKVAKVFTNEPNLVIDEFLRRKQKGN